VVPAALLSPTQLTCTTPEAPSASNRTVGVAVSLDGQHWTGEGAALFKYCEQGQEACGPAVCPKGWRGPQCRVECAGGAAMPCAGNGVCLDDGECACFRGYGGRACGEVLAPSNSGEGAGGAAGGAGVRKGVAIGVGVSVAVLAALAVVVWVKRADVAEQVFWALASTRFQRLHQVLGHRLPSHWSPTRPAPTAAVMSFHLHGAAHSPYHTPRRGCVIAGGLSGRRGPDASVTRDTRSILRRRGLAAAGQLPRAGRSPGFEGPGGRGGGHCADGYEQGGAVGRAGA
jgi:hypothetical protein